MAHFQTFCNALRINKVKNELIAEKQHAIQIEHDETPKLTLKQKYRHCLIDCQLSIKKCFSLPPNSWLHRFCYKIRREDTFENFMLKSVLGFIGGFILTYILFMFFVVQLNFKLSTSTIMCSVLGLILMIGLAFSRNIRCIVFLTLPQFFSKRGRQALLAYAFILAITGPAKNTLNNMGILSESLACGQEQLKSAVRQILDVIKKPFYAIKEAIKKVVKTVKMIVKKIKEILLKIKRIIMAILKVIKAAFQFLGKILSICNKELGTPFQRCTRVFENAITDCNAKLGPLFNWLCSITYLVKSVCYIVKVFDFVCMLVDFISNSIIGVVVKKVKSFIRHVRTMFYVRIKFSHSFQFNTNASQTYSQAAKGIVTEIKERTAGLVKIFDFMSLVTSFFFVFMIIKVIHYRYKFLTNERFDNNYITKEFRIVDLQRAKLGKETVLPLNHREKKLYVRMNSMRLITTEKRRLTQSAMVLLTATLKLGTHMLTDYCLFWILNLIRYYGRFQSKVPAPNMAVLHIEGHGLLADLLKSIVKAFQPLGVELDVDTVPCLPNPIPPDYDRYIQIASLLVLCWILTLLEPYGLRFRNWIMCYYNPVRAKQRSIWLYNQIIRKRSSFLTFARRQLRRKVLGRKDIAKVTCMDYLRANLELCRFCLGPGKQLTCLLCGDVFRNEFDKKIKRCQTPDCEGIYCEECFNDLKQICTICKSPIEYGDLSDMSEEKGSDDAEDESSDSRRTPKKLVKKRSSIRPRSSNKDGSVHSDTEDEENVPNRDRRDNDAGYMSETSSDHSFSYQYEVNDGTAQIEHSRSSFRDIEKQEVKDYATLSSFYEGSQDEQRSDRSVRRRKRRMRRRSGEDTEPLLEMRDMAVATPSWREMGTSMSGNRFPKK